MFAAVGRDISVKEPDTPATLPGNVSYAHVAAGPKVVGERQFMAGCTHLASCQKAAIGTNGDSAKVSYAGPTPKGSPRPGAEVQTWTVKLPVRYYDMLQY